MIVNVDYKTGYGTVNMDVEMDIDKDHPDFYKVLAEKAESKLIISIANYGEVDFVY